MHSLLMDARMNKRALKESVNVGYVYVYACTRIQKTLVIPEGQFSFYCPPATYAHSRNIIYECQRKHNMAYGRKFLPGRLHVAPSWWHCSEHDADE